MDRRSSFARAAAQGLLSGLSLVACNGAQATPATPVAPMDPAIATTAPTSTLRVGPAPPPLRPGNVRSYIWKVVVEAEKAKGIEPPNDDGPAPPPLVHGHHDSEAP